MNAATLSDEQWAKINQTLTSGDVAIIGNYFSTHPEFINRRYAETTVLMSAIPVGLEIVDALLELGADPNYGSVHGDTPLRYAGRNSDITMVSRLIEGGASLDERNYRNLTPMAEIAMARGPVAREIIEFLAEKGSSPIDALTATYTLNAGELEAYLQRQSPNEYLDELVAAAVSRKAVEIVRIVLDSGAPTNVVPMSGMPPIHRAAESDVDIEIFELLLDRGANPDIPDGHGDSVLELYMEDNDAFEARRIEMIRDWISRKD